MLAKATGELQAAFELVLRAQMDILDAFDKANDLTDQTHQLLLSLAGLIANTQQV